MWFGTLNGLNRYDGYVFTDFRHSPDDANSISDDQIMTLFEDHENNLWVGTPLGLNKFDRTNQRFIRYVHDPDDSTSISNDYVIVIFEDSGGEIWVGTAYGLNRFDRKSATFSHLFYAPNAAWSLSSNQISSLAEDPDGNLWVGTSRGLNKIDAERRSIRNYINFGNQAGLRYRPKLLRMISEWLDSSESIANILRVGDKQDQVRTFNLARESEVLVVVTGEGLEQLSDYGWIERSTGLVWQMDLAKCRYAGGHVKNRMQIQTLTLSPGQYELHFKSDASHGFGKWNALPPDVKRFWGIQIVGITPQQKRMINKLTREVFLEPVPIDNAISTILATRNGSMWVGTGAGGVYKFLDHPVAARPGRATTSVISSARPPAMHRRPMKKGVRFASLSVAEMPDVEDVEPSELLTLYFRHPKELTTRYNDEVYEKIAFFKRTRRPLAEITKVQNFADQSTSFNLTAASRVLIVAMGEAGNPMVDFGSLEKNGETIWQMRMADTRHAGGGIKNRAAILNLELTAGEYVLRYRSDHNHSYQKWNRRPPDHPEWWGVQLFDVTKKEVAGIAHLLDKKTVSTQIAGNSIRSLREDQDGNLWIATYSGLSKFDPQKATFVNYHHLATNPNSLSSDDIRSVYEDRAGTVWVGTILAGVNKLNFRKNRFKKFTANPFLENSLANQFVYAFAEDGRAGLWIGTRDGISLFNRKDQRFINFLPGQSILNNITGAVFSIIRDDQNDLWFASTSGLYRVSPDELTVKSPPVSVEDFASETSEKSSAFIHFWHEEGNDNSLGGTATQKVLQDTGGDIWVATAAAGLDRIVVRKRKPNAKKTDFQFFHYRAQTKSLPINRLRTVFEDRSGTLWVGTSGAGLCRFNRASEEFVCYHNIPGVKNSLSHDVVNDIFEDENGQLWVATYGGGLNRFDPETGRFQRFSEEDGLPNNVIYGILPDDLGNIWMSTNKGLCRFNLKTGGIKTYDMDNGLQSNEFNTGAFQRMSNGDLIFGGINGFNVIDPDCVVDNPNPPTVVLTEFKTFDEPMHFDYDISELKEIELSYKENYISFEFAALDYTEPKKNQYAYKLENFNKKWIACGNERSASFSNLNPGEYVFRVIGANNDGVWNREGTSIRVVITPPFWRTGWFVLLSFSLVMVGLLVVHHTRIRNKVEKSVELERIRLREREYVREQVSRDYHDALGHKLTKISLFSELLRRNINGSSRSADYLDKIVSASTSLGKETRDFIWTLDPDKDRLYDLAFYLNQFGESLFDGTAIEFRGAKLSDCLEKILLTMDWKRQISLIFKEALHNVLKHASSGHCQLRFDVEGDLLKITLKDDGSGFDCKGSGLNDGTCGGNGLRNMQERAQAIDGKLQIVSRPVRGTAIRLVVKMPAKDQV